MLPLTLNVNVLPLKVATVTVSAYMLTLTFATVLTVANAKLSVYCGYNALKLSVVVKTVNDNT